MHKILFVLLLLLSFNLEASVSSSETQGTEPAIATEAGVVPGCTNQDNTNCYSSEVRLNDTTNPASQDGNSEKGRSTR